MRDYVKTEGLKKEVMDRPRSKCTGVYVDRPSQKLQQSTHQITFGGSTSGGGCGTIVGIVGTTGDPSIEDTIGISIDSIVIFVVVIIIVVVVFYFDIVALLVLRRCYQFSNVKIHIIVVVVVIIVVVHGSLQSKVPEAVELVHSTLVVGVDVDMIA